MELFAFDILDKLPQNIQVLFFNPQTEQIQDSAVTIANINQDQQYQFFDEIINVLIGKTDLKMLEKNLTEKFGLTQNVATTVMSFLNDKLYNKVKDDLITAQSIYKQLSSGSASDIKTKDSSKNQNPTEIMSYIQELAKALKEKDKPKETATVIEEEKNINISPSIKDAPVAKKEDNQNISNPKIEEVKIVAKPPEVKAETLNEDKPLVVEKKDSILLKAMRQNTSSEDSKLNKYYKELQTNLSEKTKETKNVFQPPFKSSTNRGALIESFLEESTSEKQSLNQDVKLPVSSDPIKYNHLTNIGKVDNAQKNQEKSDEKFIDLGDL